MNRTSVLAITELKLLVRNRTALVNAVLLPLAIGAFLIYRGTDLTAGSPGAWASVVSMQTLMVLGFTVYLTAANALTARRQDLYLKRLRSGEASDPTILSGIVAPAVLLGLAQAVILFVATIIAGAPLPQRPELVLLGLLGGIGLCAGFAALTSGLTSTAELVQVTSLPFLFAVLGSAFWVGLTPAAETTTLMLATPGGSIASLMRDGFTGITQAASTFQAAGLLLVWVVLGIVLAAKAFRWEPRR